MNKLRMVTLVLVLLIASSAVALAGSQDFTLVNQTGADIHYVYVAPHTSKDWGSDIMGRDILATGSSVDIVFSPGERAALWDLRVAYMDGTYQEWENLNLNQIQKVTILKDGSALCE